MLVALTAYEAALGTRDVTAPPRHSRDVCACAVPPHDTAASPLPSPSLGPIIDQNCSSIALTLSSHGVFSAASPAAASLERASFCLSSLARASRFFSRLDSRS